MGGTVAMGSALHGWGFTLNTFARMYANKMKIKSSKLLPKLWGDNYFNPKTGKWTTDNFNDDGSENPRGFCNFILDPIMKMANSVLDNKKDIYEDLLKKLNIKLDEADRELTGKYFLRRVMQKWIQASDALLEMIIMHLPSPRKAQAYRTLYLYEGSMDDECAKSMMKCDPEGPLLMFISKMIPTSDGGRFYASGR